MKFRDMLNQVRDWLLESRRRQLLAGISLGVIAAIAGIATYFAVSAGGDGGIVGAPMASPGATLPSPTPEPTADVRAAEDGALRIDPYPATVAPSGDVTLSLVMKAPVAGLGAWTIDVSFDREVLGDADRCTGAGSGFLCDPSFVLADGRTVVRVRGVSLGGGLGGTGPLADIIFENVPGRLGESTQLTITVVAFVDSNDRPVRPTVVHGEIRIEAPTPTPTPQPPLTIPPGTVPTGALLFTGGGIGSEEPPGVFLVDADGVRRIGDDLYYGDLDPQQISISGRPTRLEWSPDGTKAAFWVCTERSELYVINSDGGGLTNVSNHPASDIVLCGTDAPFGGYDWSPDSSRLVFWSGREPRGLYVVNADGSGTRYLTQGRKPAWSPTGDSIVFVSEPFDDVSGASVYGIDADGSNRRLLAAVPCRDYYGGCRAPGLRWSPDGSLLAFTAVGEPPDNLNYGREGTLDYEVFVLNADGTGLTNITNRPHDGDYFGNWVNCELSLPTAGCEVTVTNVQPQRLNLREDPGTDQEVIGKLSEGDTACLLGTPALKDDTQWWPIRSGEGIEGWAAAFDPAEPTKPWLTATGRTCQVE